MWLTIKSETRVVLGRWRYYLLVSIALGLGLAIASTLAGLADTLVLRPLRLPAADRLVVFEVQPHGGHAWTPALVSPDQVRQLQMQDVSPVRRYAGARSSGAATIPLSADGFSVNVRFATVTPGFFQVFGLPEVWNPASGETTDAVVVGHDLWERRLRPAGLHVGDRVSIPDFDPETFGTRERSLRIAGIAPRGFHLPGDTDLWLPVTPLEARFEHFALIGLLQPGVSASVLAADAEQSWSGSIRAAPGTIRARAMREAIVPREAPLLMVMLLATAGLLMTVWCQAALFVAGEALSQTRALGTRLALGASRARLLGEQMVGPLYIVAAAWPVSLLIAAWLQRDIVAVLPFMAGRRADYGVVSSSLASLVLLVFLLAQALLIDRVIMARTRRIGLGLPATTAGARVPSRLAAVSVSVSLAFLYISFLLAASFDRTMWYDYGFDTKHLVAIQTSSMAAGLRSPQEQRSRRASIEAYARSLPGVTSTVRLNGPPFGTYDVAHPVAAQGAGPVGERTTTAKVRETTPGLFDVLRVPIVTGRDFHPEEVDRAPVAIVTRGLAQTLWPDAPVLNAEITLKGRRHRIVGVVEDFSDRVSRTAAPTTSPQVFLPASDGSDILLRTAGSPARQLDSILTFAAGYSAYLRVGGFSYDAMRAGVATHERANAWFMGIVAASAVLIAAIGAMVTVSQACRQGLKGAAIRLGLGATHAQALIAIVRVPLVWLIGGALTGLTGGLLLGQALQSSIRNIDVVEPIAVMLSLGVCVGVLAMSLIRPARSLRRLDCATLLKEET